MKKMIHSLSAFIERPLEKGHIVNNRFQILKHLGMGSYGNCYLVYDQLNKIKVVLKMLRFHKRLSKKNKNDFQLEQSILKELNSNNFPDFIENGYCDQKPFFIMEFINGKTFQELIFEEGKVYNEVESFVLGYKLILLMNVLHNHGIVHRDLRIPNIMVVDGNIKIIDFGLARKMAQGKTSKVNFNKIRREISILSDYYSLGHFLLFLLYSGYKPSNENKKESSWEEELNISKESKRLIRKLLAIEEPYSNSRDLVQDFFSIIKQLEGDVRNVIF